MACTVEQELINNLLTLSEQKTLKKVTLTEHQARFIASHHAYAIHNILLEWLIDDNGISTKELAKMITHSRFAILNCFLDSSAGDIEIH